MKLIDDLKWRYATKKFSNRKVSNEDLEKIIEAIRLSASSIGIQPYRLFIVDNPSLKKTLGEGSFNSQIADASHLLVFAAFDSISQESIDAYIQLIAQERETPIAELSGFKTTISSHLLAQTDYDNFVWSTKQAYIGLGTGMIAAAALKIDATPMEGFDAEKFDKLLELKKRKLKSVVLLALGYRDEENDFFANLKKVRIPKQEFAIVVN
ncbi:NAD(P)H-dependent oxidoreductase [Pontibacter actiniarum]|uniref:NAD(P)H-dependent oxidoreductase n=1 Tax=Pontibacter actiniarum TaxID=323450 RepID=A0A1X9YS62_9BACT|nr:NAD(P)H-dependent oxidoreductase [Pontibacter actiniarum]ARS35702.1 NAD(P)H-dependent oxidoreductase [Pontibacter actiniarum]